jgi:hypothetical protein
LELDWADLDLCHALEIALIDHFRELGSRQARDNQWDIIEQLPSLLD